MHDRLATFQSFMAPLLMEQQTLSSEDSEMDRMPVGCPYMSKLLSNLKAGSLYIGTIENFYKRILRAGM